MGGWSDVFGRKLPLFLPGVGGVLSTIVYLLVVSINSMGVEWLCLASVLSGQYRPIILHNVVLVHITWYSTHSTHSII